LPDVNRQRSRDQRRGGNGCQERNRPHCRYVAKGDQTKSPLLTQIDQLTLRLVFVMLAVIALLLVVTLLRGHSWLAISDPL